VPVPLPDRCRRSPTRLRRSLGAGLSAQIPCSHHAAIPLDRAVDRLGPGAMADELCARLVCTICGRRKATLRMASWSDTKIGVTALPRDKIAVGFASACAEVC